MLVEFLRYLLVFSRYYEKSDMSVCTYVRNIKRSYLKNCVTKQIRNLKICRLILLDISCSSRDMRENREWSICTADILNFPAKQDIFLKIKELCHIVQKTSEQMPFRFLRYLIYISR